MRKKKKKEVREEGSCISSKQKENFGRYGPSSKESKRKEGRGSSVNFLLFAEKRRERVVVYSHLLYHGGDQPSISTFYSGKEEGEEKKKISPLPERKKRRRSLLGKPLGQDYDLTSEIGGKRIFYLLFYFRREKGKEKGGGRGKKVTSPLPPAQK